jgi:hypothetical protein
MKLENKIRLWEEKPNRVKGEKVLEREKRKSPQIGERFIT